MKPSDKPTRDDLYEQLDSVSTGPGVYLMYDADNTVIYVGKAANLKNRLSSYFHSRPQTDPKTGVLVKKIAAFETIVMGSEKEALILESNLIKHHRPRYNVILKDDKRYPSLRLDLNEDYPCLRVVRKLENDGAVYFGPYASAGAVRKTLRLINRTFNLRKCTSAKVKKRPRPCLNYQMGFCLGPCCHPVSTGEYMKIVHEVRMFLNGRTRELIRKLQQEMKAVAFRQSYETAAALRDRIFALEQTLEKQVAVVTDFVDRDVVGIARNADYSMLALMVVREGVIQGVRYSFVKDDISSPDEIIGAFIKKYYDFADDIPKEILLPVALPDVAAYGQWLSAKQGRAVHLLFPKRGDRVRLVSLAMENAAIHLKSEMEAQTAQKDLLSRLQRRLRLKKLPRRIECFDISGMAGRQIVAGMVVFEDQKPNKSAYRKYIIRSVDKSDDYASMREVLERRFRKHGKEHTWPDLLMVDGGKGQLNIAVSVLKELNLPEPPEMIGIAKKDELHGEPTDKIYQPGRMNPVNFTRDGDLLFFLQRIRDEAHRYAITFHRRKKTKIDMQSRLDVVSGIGPKRKTALLKHFSTMAGIRQATVEELAALPEMTRKAAESLKNALAEEG